MVDYHEHGKEIVVEKVQVIDFENAVYLPVGRGIRGMLPGNEFWRSPEGWLRATLRKSHDMNAFGIIVSISTTASTPWWLTYFSASMPYLVELSLTTMRISKN